LPNALMATYYGQRATAGLIITEGTSPSPNGLGYPRIPGLFDAAQAEAWKATTTAVHEQGGKIIVQFMHRDRVGMRLSPYGVFNGTAEFPEVQAQYLELVHSLSALGLLYVHLVDHSPSGVLSLPTPTSWPAWARMPLNAPDEATFYVPGAKGYTDYPALAA
jgi:2,4-dienoyl-CoA reductase-like NADH-dependent reductase (Old Yellow Enzyme family)